MKRLALLLAASAIVSPAALVGQALAADVVYSEPPAPAPMVIEPIATTKTWTGLYIGGQAGVAFGNSSDGAVFSDSKAGSSGIFNDNNDNAGFVGGGHIGYDYQLPNNIVVGAVADINYIDAKTNRSYTTPLGSTFSSSSDVNYLGTVRGRIGYAFDSVLLYGSGGLAYAGIDNNSVTPTTAGVNSEFSGYKFSKDGDDADVGYSVGGGVDVLATQNISFGVEYLYTNLGKNEQTITGTNGTNKVSFSSDSNNGDLDFHTVWAKASYRFN